MTERLTSLYFIGLYGEDIYDVCSRIRRDDLRHVVKGLLLTPVEYDCKCLRKAMRGIGSSDDDVLIEILCARPNGYIEEIKEKYTEMYDKGNFSHFWSMW